MSITRINEHFFELRNRIFILIITWTTTITSCFLFKEIILYSIILTFQKFKPYFIITDITELFNIYLSISFFISNQILVLFTFYNVIMFLAPGLYKKEINVLKRINITLLLVLLFSFILTQFTVLPIMNTFFFQFQNIINITTKIPIFLEAKLKEYINFYCRMHLFTIINFFSFLFLVQTTKTISINYKTIKKLRKSFYFIFLLFSTVITPPDLISQILLTIFFIISYELVLIFSILIKINKATN